MSVSPWIGDARMEFRIFPFREIAGSYRYYSAGGQIEIELVWFAVIVDIKTDLPERNIAMNKLGGFD